MKKFTALLLALALTLSISGALAADIGIPTHSLEEKMMLQLGDGSGLKGSVTFSLTDTAPDGVDAAVWQLLYAALPGASLDFSYISQKVANVPTEQYTFTLNMGDMTPQTLTLESNDALTQLKSSLVDGHYATATSGDLFATLTNLSTSKWPSLWRAVVAGNLSAAEWQNSFDSAITTYMTKLSIWMNSYATVTNERNDKNVLVTTTRFVIPAAAVKSEIKQLLVDFYADTTLRALIGEIMTSRETAAYLQPSMQQTFISTIDGLQLDGEVVIERRIDMQGNMLLDSITLPFAEGQSLSSLSLAIAPDETGAQVTTIKAILPPVNETNETGAVIDLTVIASAAEESATAGIYTGRIAYTTEPEESFAVSDDESASLSTTTTAYTYNLYLDGGTDVYDAVTTRSTRDMEMTLVFRPEDETLAAQSLSVKAQLSSGSSNSSSTRLSATVLWQNLQTEAAFSMNVSARTTAIWRLTQADEASLIRLDRLSDDERQNVIDSFVKSLTEQASQYVLSVYAAPEATAEPTSTDEPLG